MREVASLASAYDCQHLPASLMQRLAMMQHFALAAQAGAQAQRNVKTSRTPRIGAQAIVLAWFSLGVLTSGALGVATLIAVRGMAAGTWPPVAFAWAAWAKAPPAAPSVRSNEGWDTVQVVIDRSGGRRAPLPLEVTGADDTAVELVMQGLPPGVTPSRGTPIGPSTWVLGRADLDGLFLTLADTAPAAFDLQIGVSVSSGLAAAGSIVPVRLVDGIEQRQAAVTGGAANAPPASPAYGSVAARAASAQGAAQRRAPPVMADATGGVTQPAEGRSWPEGASGLGAVPREPDRPSWWQMPPPSWSPFLVGQERP
jgi:hypothetical protein